MYGAEVWQIPTREINKILSTEMDVLRRSARKSRMERIKNEHIKEIMGVKEKPDIIDIIERKRLQWYGHVNPLNPELNPICYLLALFGAHHFLHVSRIRVKLLTFRLLMSYIYIWSTHS